MICVPLAVAGVLSDLIYSLKKKTPLRAAALIFITLAGVVFAAGAALIMFAALNF